MLMWRAPSRVDSRCSDIIPSLQSVAVPNERHWITYEVNSKAAGSPLILIHGTSGTAEYFFRLLAALESSGMRVIATQFPDYWSTREFAEGTVHFMKAMGIRKVR